jgi:Fanconi Anaemia group E protein FANCE
MSNSLWLPVATAPTTSMAVELAALLPPDAPLDLPCTVDTLHPRARANLAAVTRALERSLAGLPPFLKPQTCLTMDVAAVKQVTSDQVVGNVGTSLGRDVGSLVVPIGLEEVVDGSVSPHNVRIGRRSEDKGWTTTVAPPTLSAENIAHILALKRWALTSPHTPAPSDALNAFGVAVEPSSLVIAAFPLDLPLEAVSALLKAIAPRCGARVAEVVTTSVVLQRISALSAPAPRDFMNSVTTLVESHWRAVLHLFELLGMESAMKPISAPAAEVLVRIAANLGTEGAYEALVITCSGNWREEGVRVVEALLAKCKGEPGVAGPLVNAIERNIQGLEGSLRFGKLLLTAIKDVPDLATSHAEILRVVCSKSKVFLAKRALAALDPDS